MVDPDTGEFGFQFARRDPDLTPRNLGVAGSDVHELVDGPEDLSANLLAHLVLDPYGAFGSPPPSTPLELAVATDPTLIVSPDIIGNDVLDAITDGSPFDPTAVTPRDKFAAKLQEVIDGLAGTGAEVFLATLPSPSLLPIATERAQAARRAGVASDAEISEAIAEINAITADYNGLLRSTAAAYPNVHIVDLAAEVERLGDTPLVVRGETLTIGRFGGLVSLDGVHFTDTGYAHLANLFLKSIADNLGVVVPPIDLDAVSEGDPYSPSALRAAGLEGCE
jgi:lysophospholipase L1-like esterase